MFAEEESKAYPWRGTFYIGSKYFQQQRADEIAFFSVLALKIIAHSMPTYAVRFLCGVKNI